MSERASNNNNVEIFEKNESTTSDMDVFRYVKEKYQSQGIEVSTSDIEINSRIHALTEITKHTDQDISEFDKSKQSTDTPLENDELLSSHKEKVELLVSSYDEVRKEMLSIYSKISSDANAEIGTQEFDAALLRRIISNEAGDDYAPKGQIKLTHTQFGVALAISDHEDYEKITGWPTQKSTEEKYGTAGVCSSTLNSRLALISEYKPENTYTSPPDRVIRHETNHSIFNRLKQHGFRLGMEGDDKINTSQQLNQALADAESAIQVRGLLGIFKKTRPINDGVFQNLKPLIEEYLVSHIKENCIEESLGEGGGDIDDAYYSRFQVEAMRDIWKRVKELFPALLPAFTQLMQEMYNFDLQEHQVVLNPEVMKLPKGINTIEIDENFRNNLNAPQELFDWCRNEHLRQLKDDLGNWFFLEDISKWPDLAHRSQEYFDKYIHSLREMIESKEAQITSMLQSTIVDSSSLHDLAYAQMKKEQYADYDLSDYIHVLGGEELTTKFYSLTKRYLYKKSLSGFTLQNVINDQQKAQQEFEEVIMQIEDQLPKWCELARTW